MYAADKSKHLPVDDDFEWRLELGEYASAKLEWPKKTRDWTENSARNYHLVLLHCSPGLVAHLKNHMQWLASQSAQDCIALLLMIRDLTRGMKEKRDAILGRLAGEPF